MDAGMISFEKPNVRCRLSSVLVRGSIPPKYFLSSKACAGILRRAAERGKKLPALLQRAMEESIKTVH